MLRQICGMVLIRRRLKYIIGAAIVSAFIYLLVSRSMQHDIVKESSADHEPLWRNVVQQQVDASNASSTVRVSQPISFKGAQNERQRAVVEAFRHAWSEYAEHAWGRDELKPLSRGWISWMHLGLTIVDSLDTLFIMGLHEEFALARDWVAHNLTFDGRDVDVQMFEVIIRELGGLLSTYHLSGDRVFRDKAWELGSRLYSCFGGLSKIPCNRISLKTRRPLFGDISVAETGTIQLELTDLSRTTHDVRFEKASLLVAKTLHSMKGKLDGLMPIFIDSRTGKFRQAEISVGASGDSYYEYLLKQFIQTGKRMHWLKEDYLEAVEGIRKHLLRYTHPNHFGFVGALYSDQKMFKNDMEHLTCFLPGTLALGAMHGLDPSHLDLAANLTRTCYEMYAHMPTGLSPEIAGMNTDLNVEDDIHALFTNRYNAQRPETVESLFYLYRATKDPVYRDWGWTIFQAFEKHTRVADGYAGLDSVVPAAGGKIARRDRMESFYLSETLKYFYLLFDDDDLLPLTRWVFNTEAHPLPIYSS